MPRVYAFASIKGGVGKTTLTGNLGAALNKLGSDALLVDADIAMRSLTYLMGVGARETTLQDLLAGEGRVRDAVYDLTSGLDVLSAGEEISGYRTTGPQRLKECFG